MSKYKHHDIVVAWLEGKTIQQRNSSNIWQDVQSIAASKALPAFWADAEYRIKPEPVVVKYRRMLWKRWPNPATLFIETVNSASNLSAYENNSCFVKWIDAEWQEYIVDEA